MAHHVGPDVTTTNSNLPWRKSAAITAFVIQQSAPPARTKLTHTKMPRFAIVVGLVLLVHALSSIRGQAVSWMHGAISDYYRYDWMIAMRLHDDDALSSHSYFFRALHPSPTPPPARNKAANRPTERGPLRWPEVLLPPLPRYDVRDRG